VTPTTGEPAPPDRLEVLRHAWTEHLPLRVRALSAAWHGLRESWTPAALAALAAEARSVAGSATALGHAAVADAARNLELLVQAGMEAPPEAFRSRVDGCVASLARACLLDTDSLRFDLDEEASAASLLVPERVGRVLYLLSANGNLAQELGLELGYFGYSVRRFARPQALLETVSQTPPTAILVDGEPFLERLSDTRRLRQACVGNASGVGLFFVGPAGDLASRWEVVRAGADAFLARPFDTRTLVDRLDLFRLPKTDPLRVLLVESAPGRALDHLLTVQRGGMAAAVARSQEELWSALVDFAPEALLVVHAEGTTRGLELAAMVRQEEAYVDLPIVVAATDPASFEDHVLAARFALDELLPAGADAGLLLSALSAHARRERRRRRFAATDALTGLLTHGSLVQRLGAEVRRAREHDFELAYMLVNVDHLNSVNETFGHLAGNSVLRTLAQLLRRRLRNADAVARLAGDEFAVLMPETGADAARRVMDQVRAMYAGVRHHVAGGEFGATFSAGVAVLARQDSGQSLHQSARTALHRARTLGRNRVEIA
jgi:diguanylate cyclase (GGDEF)-like protein